MVPLTVLDACVCIATGVNLCCHLAPLCPHCRRGVYLGLTEGYPGNGRTLMRDKVIHACLSCSRYNYMMHVTCAYSLDTGMHTTLITIVLEVSPCVFPTYFVCRWMTVYCALCVHSVCLWSTVLSLYYPLE